MQKFYEEIISAESICEEPASTQTHQSKHHGAWPDGVWTKTTAFEEQSQSDNGLSVTESGCGEMSRQLSKTESSGSLQETLVDEKVIEELVKLSTEDCNDENDTPKQSCDIYPGTCEHLDGDDTNTRNEMSAYICMPGVDSIRNLCTVSICDNDSNDENSTVRDCESECNCSRQNSDTTDSTDCAENEDYNIDNQNEKCEDFIDTVIDNEDRQDYNINCQDIVDLDKNCLVTGTC